MPDDDTIVNLRTVRGAKKRFANHLTISTELCRNPELAGFLAFDDFAQQIMVTQPVPNADGEITEEDFQPRPLRDEDASALAAFLNTQGFRKAPIGIVRDMIPVVARRNTVHPVRAYLASLAWDGTHRLGRLFFDHCGVVAETAEEIAYVEAVTRAFFISAVARVMVPGCKVDHVLVLEGAQGADKSKFLRTLAVNPEWFSDSLPHNLESKDARSHLAGKWIVEMSELSQFRGASVETLKSYLTCQTDKFRPAYGRNEVSFKRQCVFAGTTNARNYLHDPTGNRRFWPLELIDINLKAITKIVPQLWAEAVNAYENREQWWLRPNLEKIAAEIQASRRWQDPWYEAIAEYVGDQNGEWFTTAGIFARLDLKVGERKRADEMRVADVLTELGCEHSQRRIVKGARATWAWRKK